MARPKSRPDTKQIPMRLDEALVAEVDAALNREAGENRTQAIEEGLRLWLAKRRRRISTTKGAKSSPSET